MADGGAVDPADVLRTENERLRLQLAERRYDAYAAQVLAGTLRSVLANVSRAARLGARRGAARSARAAAAWLAPPGTRRRARLRATVAPWRRPRDVVVVHRHRGEAYRRYLSGAQVIWAARRAAAAPLATLAVHPVVSAIVQADGGDLDATLASLRAQSYDRVEVVLAAGRHHEGVGPRTQVVVEGAHEDQVNAAVAAASGEFVTVLSAGDVLAEAALESLVRALRGGADAAYGDEDRADADGVRLDGHLKPATFGPETLLSYDVVGAPLLVRRALFLELGGLRSTARPVASHDFALRLSERANQLVHVAEVLVTRPVSGSPDPADATAATIPIVREALGRRGADATVVAGDALPGVRFRVAPPAPAPSVALVIPTRDRLELLEACVASVEARTTYSNYSIVICDNDSDELDTLEWLAATTHAVVRCPGPFNYSRIVNRGVAHTDADFVVTLNNDTTVATPDWLERLVGLCSLDGVGSVGVQLVHPDGRRLHEGVAIAPMPAHLSRDVNYPEPDRWLVSTRDAAAVTGACQIVRRTAWDALGGLDEDQAVGYNDVDFGVRLCAAGWRVVYTPEVVLGHHESASRGNLHPDTDVLRLVARWDLLGEFQDPSVPPALRYVTSAFGLDPRDAPEVTPVPGSPLLGASAPGARLDAAVLGQERATLDAALAGVPRAPRSARAARRIGREARAVLDDGSPTDSLRTVAPEGTVRRRALVSATTVALRARRGGARAAGSSRYQHFLERTRPSAASLRARADALASWSGRPVVSVVVVDLGGDLDATLEALRAQCYDRVELVVAADGDRAVGAGVHVVDAHGRAEDRANAAVAAASGAFVVVLHAGDLLAPQALATLVVAVQDGADAAYGDEDRRDEHGARTAPHLKPQAFGPETLLAYDVVGAPLLVRRDLFVELGGLRSTAAPAADHDLALRLAERANRLVHVADVLVTRGSAPPDVADATAATIGVVRAALERRGLAGTVEGGEVRPSARYTIAPPSPAPSVAIVIPTRDRLELLEACVTSVESRSTYANYSIVICDNDSVEPDTLKWLDACGHLVVRCPGPFNYSSIVNRGVAQTDADFVVTLNNDTTIGTPDWLEHLVGLCSLEGVASVGAKLVFPDGRVQHEGVGIAPLPVHLSRDASYGPVDRWLDATRDVSAVTGACQIVRGAVWRALGGLDERLAVAFNDVDFALRLGAAGWRVVYTPEVVLGHRESASRGELHPPEDEARLVERWDLRGRYVDVAMGPLLLGIGDRLELSEHARALAQVAGSEVERER